MSAGGCVSLSLCSTMLEGHSHAAGIAGLEFCNFLCLHRIRVLEGNLGMYGGLGVVISIGARGQHKFESNRNNGGALGIVLFLYCASSDVTDSTPTPIPTATAESRTISPALSTPTPAFRISTPVPRPSTPVSRSCCKYCSKGKPCGDTCISRSYTCRVGPGCAC